MQINKVVINASPLIVLYKANLEKILPKLFNDIRIPKAVISEVTNSDYEEESVSDIINAKWVKEETIKILPDISVWDLGTGESEVLTFALQNPDYYAIIDDKAARRCAKTLGIKTLGTGGLIVLAKRRGLIISVRYGLEKLRQSGLWISDELENLLLKEAGEK